MIAAALLTLAPTASAASRIPRPPASVKVIRGYCPSNVGMACTLPGGRVIYLARYLGVSDLDHELGHAFDYQVLTDAERAQFARIFGRSYDPATYWAAAGADDSLAEWFAEGYRICTLFPRYRGIASVDRLDYDYWPTRTQQRHVCALIRYAGAHAA